MELPFLVQYVVLCCVGWVNRWQQEVIEYQRAEIRALRHRGRRTDRKALLGPPCQVAG